MSGFYNQQQYVGGPITKKPRLGQRPTHMMGHSNLHHTYGDILLSFKEFISSQPNDINEQEALQSFRAYKTKFTKAQIKNFFDDHQEEEWFRNKYRPTELKKIEEATKKSKAKRRELYKQLIEKQSTDDFFIDYTHNDKLSNFLKNFSLLLEGATIEEIENGEALKKFEVSSMFISNLHPSIDKAMVEEFAKNHEGFLRVAVSEAQPDKGFKRFAWITYKQMTSQQLRLLTWEFNAHKFNGHETKATVHKDMNVRIRYAKFWFCHAKAAKADLKNVAKLLTYFDGDECPLLESIKDHLIEETDEEEQILGVSEQTNSSFEFTQDQEVLKALDRVILYLRVVHSYDYYVSTEYSGEDDMPQKVGTMFIRPIPPLTYDDSPQETLKEFILAQKSRIDSFLEKPTLSEAEQEELGKRKPEEYVEEFIQQNIHEKKAGEKYVCKLTKKKFTAPEFVKKHIIARCGDKLDEVRAEVAFFNNYVADPKRPM